jgi:hypothetical protein
MRFRSWLAAAVTAAALLAPVSTTPAASADFGVRAGVYTDAGEPFVGVEGLFALGNRVYLNPNFEYVFTDDPDLMTFNVDLHYDFRTRSRAYVWAGGGLGVLYSNPDQGDSNTDVGLNLLFGVGLKGDVVPYVQAKVIVSDDTEFVIGFGVRF